MFNIFFESQEPCFLAKSASILGHVIMVIRIDRMSLKTFLTRSILFCSFIALNLSAKADSKVQHQNAIKNHHSIWAIAIAMSITTEMTDRLYAKVGKPF